MNLFGAPKEYRTQLFLRDDGKFTFRKMLIKDTFLVEKKGDDIVKGWKHFFKLQFPFAGYKGLKADMVTLSYDRDILYDPYGLLQEKDKPEKNKPINQNKWITDIAETQRYKHQTKLGSMLLVDKITMFLGAATLLIVLAIAIRAVWG